MMRTHLRDEFELLLRIGALDESEAQAANERGHAAAFPRVAARGTGDVDRNTPFGQWSRVDRRVSFICMQALRDPDSITPRQREVIQLIAEGLSNDELGQELGHLPSHCEGPLRCPAAEARRHRGVGRSRSRIDS